MQKLILIAIGVGVLCLPGCDKNEPQKVAPKVDSGQVDQANSNVANSVATPTFEPIKKSNSKY